MLQNIFLFSCGKFCLELLDMFEELTNKNKFKIIAVIDKERKNKSKLESMIGYEVPFYNNLNSKIYKKLKKLKAKPIITNGNPKIRNKIFKKEKKNFSFLTLIHHNANISKLSHIKKGAIVCNYVYVGTNTVIKENVLINVASVIGHDVIILDSSVLSPKSNINGNCFIGKSSLVGSSSVIMSNVKLGNDCKLAPLSVLYKSTGNNLILKGNPAIEIIKNNER